MSKHNQVADGLFDFIADEFSVTATPDGTLFFDFKEDGEKRSFALSFQDAIKLRVRIRTKDGRQSVSFPALQ